MALAGGENNRFCRVSTECGLCTAVLSFRKSTFFRHGLYLYHVWVAAQTVIVSLLACSINRPVLVTETGDVYCAVRAET